MHPDDLRYPAIYHAGQVYLLERADAWTSSYFGGPFVGQVTGVKFGPRRLHHVATMNGDCFEPLQRLIGGGELRLLYGLCFEGCGLKYRNSAVATEILAMEPTVSTPDWPYADYPTHLPYFPLRLQRQFACTLEEFTELSCQPLAAKAGEAVVLVPPSPVLGMSLWGPDGDAECAQMVFRCDLAAGTVEAYGQCG